MGSDSVFVGARVQVVNDAIGMVQRITKSGGLVTTFWSKPQALVLDIDLVGGRLWWLTQDEAVNQKVGYHAIVDGGSPKKFATAAKASGSLKANATHGYWTSANEGLLRAPVSGDGTTLIAASVPGNGYPAEVALDGASLYWTETLNHCRVKKAPLGGGAVEEIVSVNDQDHDERWGIVVDATSIYTTCPVGADPSAALKGRLVRITPK